jgi:hypothetical protein
MSTKVENYLEEKVAWKASVDPIYPYEAELNREKLVIRLNDFPDESLYTLIVDDEEVVNFNDWPARWHRP